MHSNTSIIHCAGAQGFTFCRGVTVHPERESKSFAALILVCRFISPKRSAVIWHLVLLIKPMLWIQTAPLHALADATSVIINNGSVTLQPQAHFRVVPITLLAVNYYRTLQPQVSAIYTWASQTNTDDCMLQTNTAYACAHTRAHSL